MASPGNLFFVGLLQPLGSTIGLADAQSRWIADYLTGRYALPGQDEMQEDMQRERSALAARYVRSRRHTMQVDFADYLYRLRQEHRKGADRARRIGFGLPVPARARFSTVQAGKAALHG